MASTRQLSILVLFVSSLFLHSTLAEIICEDIPSDMCALAIASSGKRCALETESSDEAANGVEYRCKTSEIVSEKMAGYVESDRCVRSCGVDRKSVGISSDALLESEFVAKLCSPNCFLNCPNIIDLYVNLAIGEGVYLPDLCNAHRGNAHRGMLELLSSGAAPMAHSPAPGPASA